MPSINETVVDIVMPVYNEGANILAVLDSLRRALRYPARVFICYDHDEDDTLAALNGYDPQPLVLTMVRNRGRGALEAVLTGFAETKAPCVITFPADDDYNAPRLTLRARESEARARSPR